MRSPRKPAARASSTRGLEHVGLVLVLAADEDERAVDARRVRRDDHALDQQVRVLLHQLAVLEGPRLGLVGVADEVLVHRPVGRKDAFLPIAKPAPPRPRTPEAWSSASTASRLHLQRLAEHLVAAGLLVHGQRVEAGLVDVLVEQLHSGISSVSADGRAARFLSGSGGRPAIRSSTIVRQSSLGERPEVLAVDRRHRRDVARAEALEAADVEARVGAGGALHRLEQGVRAAQRARDVRAHVDRVLALRDGHEHVVERRHGGQVRGRQAHHARGLLDRGRRAPAVVALDGVQRRDRGGAEVGVLRHRRLDLGAQRLRHRRRRGVGDDRRVLGEVGAPRPSPGRASRASSA